MGTLAFLMVLACFADCPEQTDQQAAASAALLEELRKDFPFRAGMAVQEVQKLFDENNRRVNSLIDKDVAKNRATGNFAPPIYANRELHLYVYVDLFKSMATADKDARRFWVNGRTQFWVAMAIEQGKVKNIYITPGNMSTIVFPSLLFDGDGKDVGIMPEQEIEAK